MASSPLQMIVGQLRHGALARVWSHLSGFLAIGLGPSCAAWLTSLSIDSDSNEGPLVLCLARDLFIKDIRELRKRTDLSYSLVLAGYTRFQMAWTPKEMQLQTYYQSYQGPNRSRAVEYSMLYAKRLIAIAGKRRKVDAILSANFDYWQDLGFKLACKELGIPFIVLCKEHPVIPTTYRDSILWYRHAAYRFNGTAIAVAGSMTKSMAITAGVVKDPDLLVETGLPRYDAWLDTDVRKPLQKRPLITLLSFSKGYFADRTFEEVVQVFTESAQLNLSRPITFLLKAKDSEDLRFIRSLIGPTVPPNLRISHEINLFDALPKSRLVISYNSLSFVEAAMARTTLILPAWGECKLAGPEVMYPSDNPKVQSVASFAPSPKDMRNAINACINEVFRCVPDSAYLDFINEYIYLPSRGTCSNEVAKLLTRFMPNQSTSQQSKR